MAGAKRMAVAAVVALGCLILLSPMAPDPGDYDAHVFWLKFDGAVRYFFAIAVGAVIARRSIVVPAAAIAGAAWIWVIYALYRIALPAGPVDFGQLALSNLDGLAMMVVAGVGGAMLGRWFYRLEFASS